MEHDEAAVAANLGVISSVVRPKREALLNGTDLLLDGILGPDNTVLLLTGKLEAGDQLAEAGLACQVKAAKAAAA